VVYAVLLAPLPYPNPDQLVIVWSKVNGHRNSVSAGDYLDWKRQSTVFQDVGAWSGGNFNLSVSAHPEVVRGRINSPGLLNMQGIRFFMGRLKPGVTLQQANAEMDSVTRHIAEIYPASNKAWSASVESLHHDFTGQDTIKGLWLLMGAVGFVLLIACVNVANMLLARGTV